MSQVVNIPDFLNERRISSLQISVALLCATAIGLDGFDAQALGFIAPTLSRDWALPAGALGPVFGAALFGMMIGALLFGALADYLGRKWLIVAGVVVFGACAIATTWTTNLTELAVVRFITGLGLGGVLPNAIALTSEYGSKRRRTLMVMLMFSVSTIGSAIGGAVAVKLVPTFGWQSIFWIGGLLPLALVPVLLVWLPESLSLLALRKSDGALIKALLARIDPSAVFAPDTQFAVEEESGRGLLVPYLFRNGRALVTVLLWIMFFMNLLDIYFLNNWLPTLINTAGLDVEAAIAVGVAFQLGGALGTLGLGFLIDRFDFYRVLFATYVVGCLSLLAIGRAGASPVLLVPAVFMAGVCVIGGQIGSNAFAARYYPTFIRSTGVGWALGIGRIGSIVGPVVGGLMLAAHWRVPALFGASAIPQLCSAIVLLSIAVFAGRSGADETSEPSPRPRQA